MPPLSLRADLGPRSIDEEERSVELIFTTGAGVRRRDYWTGKEYIEVLSLDPKAIRLDRLNDGAPLLDSHSAWSVADQLGAVVPGSVKLMKKSVVGRVRFSRRDTVEGVWGDVRDAIVRSVSIGYRVYRFEETQGEKDEIPTRTAVDWEPFEVSMVPIPADAGAKVRSGDSEDANACEIVPSRTADIKVDVHVDGQKLAAALGVRAQEPPKKEEKKMDRNATDPPEPSQFLREPDPLAQPKAVAPPAEPPEPNERKLAAEAERERVMKIRTACKGRFPRSFEDELISSGEPYDVCADRIFQELNKQDVANVPRQGDRGVAVTGDDPLVHARAGIASALLNRVAPERFQLDDVGRPYRGMSVLDIGRAFLGARGVRVTQMSRSQLVDAMLSRAGMHSTSDFPSLLEDVANKNLRSAYEAAPQTWLSFARPVNLSDFKPSRQLQVGDAPGLDEILEHGEFTFGSITEAKEAMTLKTYGKIFAITRQALINDDLNAFGMVPAAFGRKARDKESDLAWAQITGNPAMGDGVTLFHAASHGNYTASGTAISVDSLGVGRTSMRKQKGIDGETPLNLAPRYLIVPAAKETIADQFVTLITPAENAKANPFGPNGRTPLTVIPEPRLDGDSGTAWYLACPVEQAPVLYYGTLDGQSGPDLRQEEGFGIDGIKFRCRLDVVFKAADWRAIYKNAGA